MLAVVGVPVAHALSLGPAQAGLQVGGAPDVCIPLRIPPRIDPGPSPAAGWVDVRVRGAAGAAPRTQARASLGGGHAVPAADARPSPSSRRWRKPGWAALAALALLLGLWLWQRRPPRYRSPRDACPAPARGPARPWRSPAGLPMPQAPDAEREGPARSLAAAGQVQVDELLDHAHLADFFIGIGDHDKAIDIMRRALLEADRGPGALPCLYLLDLYRRGGRRQDYEGLLAERGMLLNARIPDWDEPTGPAPRDLLEYPRALARLSESWNSAACPHVIERMIAGDPLEPRVGFELPAYRDLLELHALACELQRAEAGASTPPPLDWSLDLAPLRGRGESRGGRALR